MSEKSAYIDSFHSNSIFLPTRTIKLTGDIDEKSYDMMISNLHALDQQDGTITIIMNSGGGDVIHGKAIYRAIRECKNYVRIKVYGEASSSASFILQAADERLIATEAYIMLHVGEEAHPLSHPKNIERWHAYNKISEKWMEDIYLTKIKSKKPRYTRNQLKSMLMFDKILTPKEALELGLVDRIIE